MLDFLRSVAASLVAAFLVLALTVWKSKFTRRALTALASAALGVDVKYVYRNGDEASSDIKDKMSESHQVRILTGRGNEFQRPSLRLETIVKLVQAKVLIQCPGDL